MPSYAKIIFAILFTISLIPISFAAANETAVTTASINTITNNDDKTAFDIREENEQATLNNPFAIALYKPTYILPFYFTTSPYQQIYIGNTPNNQIVQRPELKAQISFKLPLVHNIIGNYSNLSVAYTQLMYWQVYANSQYFRETNYQPEIFLAKKITPNLWANIGAEHQSNGRGGSMERSWNRAYVNAIYSTNNFAIKVRPWLLIFRSASSKLHNDSIEDYMGHGEIIFAYKWHKTVLSLNTRNNFESGFKRGGNEINYSFPIFGKIKGYMQFFSGYGQSLIEYDHYTNAFGVGLTLNDWI